MPRRKVEHPALIHEKSPGGFQAHSTRKRQLFDWDDMGLGLGMDVSSHSGTTSDHSDGSNGPVIPHGKLNFPNPPRRGVHRPTYTWVKSLAELRLALLHLQMDENRVTRRYGKPGAWLHDQLVALKAGTIPVTLKCILAASGISRAFIEARDQFQKPEYRTRYWNWSVNFIALVDHFTEHGTLDIPPNSTEFIDVLSFIRHSRTQKKQGTLSLQRDQLLTALGMTWEVVQSEESSENESSEESPVDETWQMPVAKPNTKKTKPKAKPKPKPKAKAKKRKPISKAPERRVIPQKRAKYQHIPAKGRNRESLLDWAGSFLKLRRWYQKDDGYDIPANRPNVTIWMNAESARYSAGALSDECRGILKWADLTEPGDALNLDTTCEKWCKSFVEYVDFVLRHGRKQVSSKKAPHRVARFLFECRIRARDGILLAERDLLLRGIDNNWQNSYLAMGMAHPPDSPSMLDYRSDASDFIPGHVVEVVLDSGRIDRPNTGRKRRKTIVCQQMVSSMIRGIVGESVEGRSRTLAERDAEEWVCRAGAKALNNYAKNWFKTASVD